MARMKIALLGMTLGLFVGSASALDSNDVIQMIRNGVQDPVIINMIQNQKMDRPLTAQEVVALSAAGASSSLLEYMTRPEAVSSSYVPPAPRSVYSDSTPTIVTSEPTVTTAPPATYYGSNSCSPTVVTPAPTIVAPSTTYVVPYSYPVYTYSYPRYRYYEPSYSFGFSWGGGSRWGHGPRYGHRPPYRGHGRPGGRPHRGRR